MNEGADCYGCSYHIPDAEFCDMKKMDIGIQNNRCDAYRPNSRLLLELINKKLDKLLEFLKVEDYK